MKTLIIPYLTLILILGLFSCSSKSASIPENIKQEVETIVGERESSFDHVHEKFVGFDWNFTAIKSADSIVYPFAVIYERDGKEYPFGHKCIVKIDTLGDIQKFDHLFNSWVSIMPIQYNVRNEDWWVELVSKENIQSLEFDHRKLELLDSMRNSWREVFLGNVTLVIGADTLLTDTLYWNPILGGIYAPNCKVTVSPKGKGVKTTLHGSRFISDGDLTEWSLENVTGSYRKEQ